MNKSFVIVGMALILYIGCEQEKFTQGRIIYETLCLNCHMQDGSGLGKLYPSIIQSNYLTTLKDKLPCLIRYGNQSEQLETVYMPAHPDIAEASMTNLVNYLSYTWGDKEVVQLSTIREQIEACSQ